MIQNETITNILTRVTVRRFTDEPVSDEALHILLKLKDCLPYAKMINKGCTGIVVCGDVSLYESINKMDKEDNTLYWVQDCSAASENLLLAAHSIGLGAVWTGIYPLESRVDKLRDLLSVPVHIVPLNLILVGHPVNIPQPKNKWNKTKIHYDKF